MKRGSIALLLMLGATTAFAQQPVPEIPYTANADFLKLPADLYLGEVAGVAVNSKGHVFVFSRGNNTGPAFGATGAQLLEFDKDGKFVREIGKNLYAWAYAHTVRVDTDDNIWAVDKGSDMVVKFTPEGRVVDGVRPQEGSVRRGGAVDAGDAAAAARRRQFPSADRRHLGHAGEHLHQRRLHQFASGQVRQERRLGEVVGREGHQTRRIQHAAQHRLRRAGQHLRRRPRQPPHSGLRPRRQVPARDQGHRRAGSGRRPAGDRQSPHRRDRREPAPRRAVGRVHHARARIRCSTRRIRIRAGSTS